MCRRSLSYRSFFHTKFLCLFFCTCRKDQSHNGGVVTTTATRAVLTQVLGVTMLQPRSLWCCCLCYAIAQRRGSQCSGWEAVREGRKKRLQFSQELSFQWMDAARRATNLGLSAHAAFFFWPRSHFPCFLLRFLFCFCLAKSECPCHKIALSMPR